MLCALKTNKGKCCRNYRSNGKQSCRYHVNKAKSSSFIYVFGLFVPVMTLFIPVINISVGHLFFKFIKYAQYYWNF